MKRKTDHEYLDWIRQQDCAACGAVGPSEAHHFIGEFHVGGMGMKAPDWMAMPLCRTCHQDMHESGKYARSAQREAFIRTIIRAFEEGMIGRL